MSNLKLKGKTWVHGSATTLTPLIITRTNEFLTRFGDLMDSAGSGVLTRTSDTGQYVPGSYVAANVNMGYYVYRWRTHGTDIFIKFNFTRGGLSTNSHAALTITIGQGTNGAGTITGLNKEISRCMNITRDADATYANSPFENYESDFYVNVNEDIILFLVGSNPNLPSAIWDMGTMFCLTRPMLSNLSGVDPTLVTFRSWSKTGISSAACFIHYMSVINTTDYSYEFSDNVQDQGSSYLTSYFKAKEYYALPFGGEMARDGSIFAAASYVRTSTDHRLDRSVIIAPYTGRFGDEDIITFDGKKYIRTMCFGNAANNTETAYTSGNTGSCLAFLWE